MDSFSCCVSSQYAHCIDTMQCCLYNIRRNKMIRLPFAAWKAMLGTRPKENEVEGCD